MIELGFWPLSMIDDRQPGFVDRRAEVLAALKAKRSQAEACKLKDGMGLSSVPAGSQPVNAGAGNGSATAAGAAGKETQAPVVSPFGFYIALGADGKARIMHGEGIVDVGTPENMAAELPKLEAAMWLPLPVTGRAITAALEKFPWLAGKYRAELEDAAEEVFDLLAALPPADRAAAAEKAIADRINRIADEIAAKTPGMTREEAIEGFRTMTDQSCSQSIASAETVSVSSPSMDVLDVLLAELGIYENKFIDDTQPGFVDRRGKKLANQSNATGTGTSGQMELGL